MAQVRVLAFDVGKNEVEASEAAMAKWIDAGWNIAGTNFHSYYTGHTLWVTFVKTE